MKILIVNTSECGGHIKIFEYQDKKKVVLLEDEVFAKGHKEFHIEANQKMEISPK
jgi:hypothetical protein